MSLHGHSRAARDQGSSGFLPASCVCCVAAPSLPLFLFRFLVPTHRTDPGVSVHHSSGFQPRLHQHRGMENSPGCAAGDRAQHDHGGLCSQPSPAASLSISTLRCHLAVQTLKLQVFLPGSLRHTHTCGGAEPAPSSSLHSLHDLSTTITAHPALCHHPPHSPCPPPELSFALGLRCLHKSTQPRHQHHPEPQQSDAAKPPGDEWGTCSERVSLEIKQ